MKSKGFTLIELLVAVMIVGILSAVAVSSYQDYITRASRADAKAVLMEVAGWMERNYSAKGCYHHLASSSTACTVEAASIDLPAALTQSPKTGTARYGVALAADSTSYSVMAGPLSPDAECGALTLDNLGNQGLILDGSPVPANKTAPTADERSQVAACWQR